MLLVVVFGWQVLIFVLLFSECFLMNIFFPIIRKNFNYHVKNRWKAEKCLFCIFYKTFGIICFFYTLLIELRFFYVTFQRKQSNQRKWKYQRGQSLNVRSYAQNSSKSFVHVTSTQMYRHALSTKGDTNGYFFQKVSPLASASLGISLDEHQTFHHEDSLFAVRLVGTWLL